MRIALDTDVLIAGLRSETGASREIIYMIGRAEIVAVVSVPMLIEYEAVVKRPQQLQAIGITTDEADTLINVLAVRFMPVTTKFSWRPQLADPNDEMILEAAINGQADAIVTFNTRHFEGAVQRFGVEVLRPGALLELLRRLQP